MGTTTSNHADGRSTYAAERGSLRLSKTSARVPQRQEQQRQRDGARQDEERPAPPLPWSQQALLREPRSRAPTRRSSLLCRPPSEPCALRCRVVRGLRPPRHGSRRSLSCRYQRIRDALWDVSQDFVVDSYQLLGHAVPGVPSPLRTRRLPKRLSDCTVSDHAFDRPGEQQRLLRLDEEAVVSVLDYLWDAPHSGGHHRNAELHGLDLDPPKLFVGRGKHKQVASGHHRGNESVGHEAGHAL